MLFLILLVVLLSRHRHYYGPYYRQPFYGPYPYGYPPHPYYGYGRHYGYRPYWY